MAIITALMEQTTVTVDDIEYLITALPTTEGLKFFERFREQLIAEKEDLSLQKSLVISCVDKGGIRITQETFDKLFSRKYAHLKKLYDEVLKWNYPDFFVLPGSEE